MLFLCKKSIAAEDLTVCDPCENLWHFWQFRTTFILTLSLKVTGDRICNSSHVFRYSINCPEYEIWKKAFLRGGYSPYASSGRTLIEQSKFIYPTVNYYLFKDRQLFGYASIFSIYPSESVDSDKSVEKSYFWNWVSSRLCGLFLASTLFITY